MKNRAVSLRPWGTVAYPALKGKIVKQVRFENDKGFTALVIEFEDNTHVSFRLKATVGLLVEPEISILKNEDVVNWKKLKAQPVRRKRS
jgi:hypothetical protein